jgi:hypothetical protein
MGGSIYIKPQFLKGLLLRIAYTQCFFDMVYFTPSSFRSVPQYRVV